MNNIAGLAPTRLWLYTDPWCIASMHYNRVRKEVFRLCTTTVQEKYPYEHRIIDLCPHHWRVNFGAHLRCLQGLIGSRDDFDDILT